MKIQVGRNEILSALQSVIGVVERRQTLPVLSNFLLEAKDDQLVVTGTDLEMELVGYARVQNHAPGRLTVPARKLYDICRGLPEGAELTLEATGDKATVKSGKSRFTLSALKADEFPAFGTAGPGATLTITKGEFKQLLERTSFAMAQQDVRYYLNGLLVEITPRRIRAVATDGHRLAFSELQIETGITENVQAIVPRKAVMELSRLLDGGQDTVTLTVSPGQVAVDLDTVKLTTKTIDGRFPDYERVIPEKGERNVLTDRETLRKALARTAILSNEKFRGVRLQLEPGLLRLQTHNPEHEEAEEELEVDYDGAAMEIGFNVNYLLDALAALQTDSVVIELKNSDSSGLLHEADSSASKYVIMPMRL